MNNIRLCTCRCSDKKRWRYFNAWHTNITKNGMYPIFSFCRLPFRALDFCTWLLRVFATFLRLQYGDISNDGFAWISPLEEEEDVKSLILLDSPNPFFSATIHHASFQQPFVDLCYCVGFGYTIGRCTPILHHLQPRYGWDIHQRVKLDVR
jgi:hypothetical protein